MSEIELMLFGAFRRSHSDGKVRVPAHAPMTVAELKAALSRDGLGIDPGLLAVSVVADESRILAEAEQVRPGQRVALLPPVCGG